MKRRVAPPLALALASALTLAVLAWGGGTRAETGSPEQLKAVEKDLRSTQAERDRLQQESDTVARELGRAQRAKIALAKDIQDQEYSILLLENRISSLEAEADSHTAALARRDKQMGQALLALERLALHPGDALTLTPLAPDDAVRAAILLRAAVPQIATSTATLQTELAGVYRRRSEIVAQREQVAAAAAMLVAKRAKLDALIEVKAARQSSVTAENAAAETRMADLARQAEDLRALFAKLAEDKARRQAEARQARQEARNAAKSAGPEHDRVAGKAPIADQSGQTGTVPENEPAAPAANTGEEQSAPATASVADADAGPDASPGRLFSKARGTLPFPAVGRLVTRYGQSANGGQLTKGITIATRPGATVVSPYDGVVAFAGPFRGYGELLIVEHSEGYHTLMAGMARIDSAVGTRVLAGEPVAVMADDGEPSLYVELRRDGQPINPLPWLADRGGSDKTR
ncbi:MAG: peptidase M23 [Rhodospirillaceae bacterium]|nr:MAG: peptidase M23 [Rhodospirillaceae bacterium]